MKDADLEQARQCHAALREIFIHHPGGWADKDALRRVEQVAWQAMRLVPDAECQEKMGIVEHHAAALYSDEEHHRWRTTSLPGADFLRLQILRALVAFHGRLFAIEAERRTAAAAAEADDEPTPLHPQALPGLRG